MPHLPAGVLDPDGSTLLLVQIGLIIELTAGRLPAENLGKGLIEVPMAGQAVGQLGDHQDAVRVQHRTAESDETAVQSCQVFVLSVKFVEKLACHDNIVAGMFTHQAVQVTDQGPGAEDMMDRIKPDTEVQFQITDDPGLIIQGPWIPVNRKKSP